MSDPVNELLGKVKADAKAKAEAKAEPVVDENAGLDARLDALSDEELIKEWRKATNRIISKTLMYAEEKLNDKKKTIDAASLNSMIGIGKGLLGIVQDLQRLGGGSEEGQALLNIEFVEPDTDDPLYKETIEIERAAIKETEDDSSDTESI